MTNDNNIVEFKKKMKNSLPPESRWVTIVISENPEETFLEHDERLNPFEIIGMMHWGQDLMMSTMKMEPEVDS